MNLKGLSLILAISAPLFAVAGTLMLLSARGIETSIARPSSQLRYVAPGGTDDDNDCASADKPCVTIQHAVNQTENSFVLASCRGPSIILRRLSLFDRPGIWRMR